VFRSRACARELNVRTLMPTNMEMSKNDREISDQLRDELERLREAEPLLEDMSDRELTRFLERVTEAAMA